jgi:ribonucleoside-diphosphate reductase alpha chain
MGFHSLLQKSGVPWESEAARDINKAVFMTIKARALQQTRKLADERGEYLDGKGTGRRNSHLLAIAPNASSGIILSTSPSIEPLKANAYTHRTRAGSFLVKNEYLSKILDKRGENNDATWTSIITNKGSVQHLPFLKEGEKAVFKTADELNQNWVIKHAADRQPYICQGQSVNLFFPSGASKSYVSKTHLKAWKSGLKGLYYLRTESTSRAENVSEKVERVALKSDNRSIIYGKDDCPYCQLAKEELTFRNIDYEYISLTDINKTASEVTGRDVYTVPQIYIDGQYIGGYAQLMETEDEECLACEG